MNALATLDMIERALGRPFTGSAEAARAADLLEIVHATLSRYTGLLFDEGTIVETVRGDYGPELFLSQRPVRAIVSVSAGGLALSPGGYAWNSTGVLLRASGTWGGPWQSIVVTYDYGFGPDDPSRIALAAWEADKVAGLMRSSDSNPDNVRQESIGSYSVTYSAESLNGQAGRLTIDDGDLIDRILGQRSRLYSLRLARP